MEQNPAAFSRLSWYPFSEEPVIGGSWNLLRVGEPVFLFPEESPDGRWHLFAQSFLGIEHFSSENGISWQTEKLVVFRGRTPSLFFEDGMWYLLYEERSSSFRRRFGRAKSRSEIKVIASEDLVSFGAPVTLLEADALGVDLLSSPQLLNASGEYRLYYGVGERSLLKTRQRPNKALAVAIATAALGPYIPYDDGKPILRADADSKHRSMATGRVRIIPLDTGFVALESAYFWNTSSGTVASTLIQLESEDGLSWSESTRAPILTPPKEGWASSFLLSCDVRYKESEACWYCYYSANSRRYRFFKQEAIGLLLGKQPALRRLTE